MTFDGLSKPGPNSPGAHSDISGHRHDPLTIRHSERYDDDRAPITVRDRDIERHTAQ